jgi:pre-mRNA-splicing factor SYF1
VDDALWEALNNTFERALSSLHKMPVIWLLYLQHLAAQRLFTRTRHAFDRCASLPPPPATSHHHPHNTVS